ncbi:hypothetical protein IMCC20628_01741 [Hoeflea sp. IMCC20628]|uniref:hypothetical protein n=1 Tax=Hoeflea sp. IMCC20628 TaxID=1620421 RepID=UPI00063A8A55|nr:hypothetical protein [Hoeflea sp. IMCC20628]AKI00454.1 hypothetical protein IMCC20628_01741 [Hoeflea sp. IMCC20628]
MPSIQGNSYTVSALVPSMMPSAPAVTNDTKSTQVKTDAARPSSQVDATAARSNTTSDRVNAFLATEQSAKTDETRPDRPPPPPPGSGPPKSGAAGASANQTEALDESETALLLLETEETDDEDEAVEDTDSESISILFDEADTYQPSSLY